MKKLVSFLVLIVAFFSYAYAGKNTLVKNAAEFNTAWNSYSDGDTISVAYSNGLTYNVSTKNMSTAGGRLTIKGQYADDDSVPIIQASINVVTLSSRDLDCSLVFEYVHLQYKDPSKLSGQIIYSNKETVNIDSLIFRHCVISNSVRCLFRSVVATDSSSAGDLNYLELSNCLVHNTFSNLSNNWPLLYLGHLPVEVVIKNNTFYDLPYMKNVFAMSYAEADQGRTASIDFSNNTVCVSGPTSGLINTGAYLGAETQFTFNNNLLLTPNWVNSLNIDIADSSYSAPKMLSAKFGMVSAANNLIESYNSWESGQVIDDDGDGAFISLDTIPQYKMAELNVSWSDFTDVQNGDFSYLYTSPLATAGSDGGPIGDPRWVRSFNNPKTLTVTSNAENAVITPAKGVYENGSTVSVAASVVTGYNFSCWKDTLGNVISTANPYEFTITSDVNLVAYYDALLSREVSVSISGSKSATYTISPVQTTYYVGDVVTTTLNDHAINDFLGWSDGKTSSLTRTDTLVNDLVLTASFSEYPYVAAWDLCNLTANNQAFSSLTANHVIDSTYVPYAPVLQYKGYKLGGDTIVTFQTRNNKFSASQVNNCIVRKTPAANFSHPDYVFIKMSTKGLSGVRVTSKMGSDNCLYKVQKLQYSLTGNNYVDFASDTISAEGDAALNTWFDVNGTLPVIAENQDTLYVRWIADSTSSRVASAVSDQAYEFAYISEIVVRGFDVADGTSWRVNPLLSYTGGQVISSVPGITLKLGGSTNVWTVTDSINTFGDATYVACLNGNVNPINDAGTKFSASGIPPTVGAFYRFDVTVDGTLDAALLINANKASYIVENTTALAGYSAFTVATKSYVSYSIPVIAGKSYYFFSEASKMGIMGFVYQESPTALNSQTLSNDMYTSGGILYIKAAQEGLASLFDLMGRKVASVKLNEGLNNVSGLKKGIYLVKIGTETSKVIL
jgi:hypothetical protein